MPGGTLLNTISPLGLAVVPAPGAEVFTNMHAESIVKATLVREVPPVSSPALSHV